jgi:hypothetical protein
MTDNEYHLITFDPGSAATGWTWFVMDFHAFSRPKSTLWGNVITYDYGEFRGDIEKIQSQCVHLVHEALALSSYLTMDVVCEDFELTQLIGGRNLLSPVIIGSVIEWECRRRAVKFNYQARQLRTSVTRQRLNKFGFEGKFRKDEFAAMQHAVVWLRRLKQKAKERPWKLSSGGVLNAGGWDCACTLGRKCDIWHPQTR